MLASKHTTNCCSDGANDVGQAALMLISFGGRLGFPQGGREENVLAWPHQEKKNVTDSDIPLFPRHAPRATKLHDGET